MKKKQILKQEGHLHCYNEERTAKVVYKHV